MTALVDRLFFTRPTSHVLLQKSLNPWVIEHIGIEHISGRTTLKRVNNLFHATLVEPNSGFNSNARIVIGTDNAGVIFVNRARLIDRFTASSSTRLPREGLITEAWGFIAQSRS